MHGTNKFSLWRASIFCILMNISFISCTKNIDTFNQVKKYDAVILFVGNSLTYTNDLPQILVKHAESKGKKIKTESLTLPNYALVDHLAEGKVQKLVDSKKYNFVIVQQGPSSQEEGRKLLFEAAEIFKDLCAKNDAKLAFYMVWPAHANYHHFDGVIKNYTEAASKSNAILCPVGKVWKDYIDKTNDLTYYGQDLFHPSEKGSQVVSEVIYNSLFP
jgi:hypothetical protein